MKLIGDVLKRFKDKETGVVYAPIGTKDIEEYTYEETTYPHIYIGDKLRYEELQSKGYLSEGKLYDEEPKESRRTARKPRRYE